jgi:hypothetical protein
MRSYPQVTITDCNDDDNFKKLYAIFTGILCPGMSERVFLHFYHADTLQYIDVTFIEEADKTIGFCAAAFYTLQANNTEYVIGRAAIGLLPEYQGGGLPIKRLFYKFIRYKCRYPKAQLVLTGYIANPLVYDMICRYTGIMYPMEGQKLSSKMASFHDAVIKSQVKPLPGKHAWVTKLHFHVAQSSAVMQRVWKSTSRHVKAYLKMNPDYNGRYGLIVLVPVTWSNIVVSVTKLTFRSIRKWFKPKYK